MARIPVFRALALVALLVAPVLPFGAAPALASATAEPEVLETLANPSLEGAPGAANGFELRYEGAQQSVVSRSGAAAVDLAKATARPQPWFALGRVDVRTTHAVLLSQVRSFSFHEHVPAAPSAPIQLRVFAALDSTGDGAPDACLLGSPRPLAQTAAYTQVLIDGATEFRLAPADCADSGAVRTLSSLQADPALANARIGAIFLQTEVSSDAMWPVGEPVYVDDVSLLATSSPNVRIRQPSLNLCGGASFRTVQMGLACAADGAEILVGPGVYDGPFVVDRRVTLCATSAGTQCQDNTLGATLRGNGAPVVVEVRAASATVRGFRIENPSYAATGDVEPALVRVDASYASVVANHLRRAAAELAPGESRRSTSGIVVAPGATGVVLSYNQFYEMPSSLGVGSACANAPCVTYAIRTEGDAPRLAARGNSIDFDALSPSTGILASGDRVQIDSNLIRVSVGQTGRPTDSHAIVARGVASNWTVGYNTVRPDDSDAPLVATGIEGAFRDSVLYRNRFQTLAAGLRLLDDPVGRVVLTSNEFGANLVGLSVAAPDVAERKGVFADNFEAIVLEAGAARFAARNLTFTSVDVAQEALALRPTTRGLAVDMRENEWGAYTRASIRALIDDEGEGNVVDESCFIDADKTTRVCPPVASFVWTPAAPAWGRDVQFVSTATGRGREIASHAWTFADAGTSTARDPVRAFPLPGDVPVTLRVTDTEGYVGESTQVVRVVNTAPRLAPIGEQRLAENQTMSLLLSAVDDEGDALAFAVTDLPRGATFDAAARRLNWTPDFTQSGAYVVRAEVTDGLLVDTEDVVLLVNHTNAPPTISILGFASGRELVPLEFFVRGADVDGDAVSLVGFAGPVGSTFTAYPNGTAQFRWTPDFTAAGQHQIYVQASDGQLRPQWRIPIDVWQNDRAPVWRALPDRTVAELQRVSFLVEATDADGDVLTYSMVSAPFGASFDPARRAFEWTPTFAQQGVHTVTFRVSDGNLTTNEDVLVTVTNVNRPPIVGLTSSPVVLANRTLAAALNVSDPDGDALRVRAAEARDGLAFDGTLLRWRPTPDQVGVHNLTLLVDDGTATVTGYVVVEVAPNQAPTITLQAPSRTETGDLAVFSSFASDPEGAAVRYAWDFDDRDGLAADATGPDATWRFAAPGLYNVTLVATDADGIASTVRRQVLVDDRLFLTLVVGGYTLTSSAWGAVSVRDWSGAPLARAPLTIVVTAEPVKGQPGQVLRTMELRTEADGTCLFVIPRDTAAANLPVRHVVTVSTRVPTSYLGDAETATATGTYGPDLP